MNFLQKIESFFGFGPKPTNPTTPPTPSQFQTGINTAGTLVDEAEALVDKFQPLTAVLPAPFSVYLGALVLAVHGLDSYVDTLETPAVTPAPTPAAPPASVPAAPGATPTAQL